MNNYLCLYCVGAAINTKKFTLLHAHPSDEQRLLQRAIATKSGMCAEQVRLRESEVGSQKATTAGKQEQPKAPIEHAACEEHITCNAFSINHHVKSTNASDALHDIKKDFQLPPAHIKRNYVQGAL